MCISNALAFLFIQVSSVKELSLRGNPLQGQTFAIDEIGPTVTQYFTLAKLAILT